MTDLTIVVPCFNRHDLLDSCLGSIDSTRRPSIQLVVVDDGSSPALAETVARHSRKGDLLIEQQNRGRAAALRAGLLAATGDYVLIMDSDDAFLPGALDTILDDIAKNLREGLLGFVYPMVDFYSGAPIAELTDGLETTLLALRADHGVHADLKEVVATKVVQSCLYADPGDERRVPTSYIWAGVSRLGCVKARSVHVVRHRYLQDGMTKNIRTLKRRNPYWLAQTYLKIATSPPGVYVSKSYRWKRAVQAAATGRPVLSAEQKQALIEALGWGPYYAAVIAGFFLRLAR